MTAINDITEIARKQRHLHLLEKIKASKRLTRAELTELTEYEKATNKFLPKMPAAPAKRRVKHSKRSTKKRKRRLISALRLERLAFASENMTEADQAAGFRRSLADIMAGDKQLAAAWARGQFLRKLEKAASMVQSLSQAAVWLKIPGGGPELRRMLDDDEQAKDVWDNAWLQAEMDIKEAILEAAKGGNAQAIKTIETWIRAESTQQLPGGGRISFNRVTMMQLTEIFGVSRQSIDLWVRNKSCPRNPDSTFHLREVIQWFEQYVQAKASSGPAVIDPMRSLKTRKIEIELDQRLGRLLDRDSVIAGQVNRIRNLVNSLAALPRDVAPMLENQSLLRIREILENWRRNVLTDQKKIPQDLELPDEAAEKLKECFENLV